MQTVPSKLTPASDGSYGPRSARRPGCRAGEEPLLEPLLAPAGPSALQVALRPSEGTSSGNPKVKDQVYDAAQGMVITHTRLPLKTCVVLLMMERANEPSPSPALSSPSQGTKRIPLGKSGGGISFLCHQL